jgi:thiazole synthase
MLDLGQASDATIAMELGCDGVLVNTAIAKAKKPLEMALAFKNAVVAGRQSYLSGRIEKSINGKSVITKKRNYLVSFLKKLFFL